MNQNIVLGTQHRTRHAKRKTDRLPHLQLTIQLKKNTAGGNIPRQRRNLPAAGRRHHGQHQRKPHSTSHLLPCDGRLGNCGWNR